MHAELPKGERFNGSVVFESKISPCYARNKVELFDELGNSFIWNRNANNAKLKVDERYNDIVDIVEIVFYIQFLRRREIQALQRSFLSMTNSTYLKCSANHI